MNNRAEVPSVFQLSKLPSLDGWRGLSILAVLFGHGWQVPGYPQILKPLSWGAETGVQCFFVISGYLITTLLLREIAKQQKISLLRFFERRALRLFPAYFGFVLVIALLHLTPFKLSTQGWLGLLTFTANVYPGNDTTAHFWSLAVEQQFYLIWPPLFVAFACKTKPSLKWAVLLLMVPILLCPVSRCLETPWPGAGWLGRYSYFNQADLLAWGCLLALLADQFPQDLERVISNKPYFWLLVALFLVAVPKALAMGNLADPVMIPFRASLSGIGFAIAIAWTIVFQHSMIGKFFNKGWLPKLGVVSYSIYVWHMIFFTKPQVFGLGWAPWGNFAGFLATSIIAGVFSWYYLERPFFSMRRKLKQ